jgi:hypothetical protein
MFDDKPFPRSKLCFNMLQLTRLFINCIEETIRELHIAHDVHELPDFYANRRPSLQKRLGKAIYRVDKTNREPGT